MLHFINILWLYSYLLLIFVHRTKQGQFKGQDYELVVKHIETVIIPRLKTKKNYLFIILVLWQRIKVIDSIERSLEMNYLSLTAEQRSELTNLLLCLKNETRTKWFKCKRKTICENFWRRNGIVENKPLSKDTKWSHILYMYEQWLSIKYGLDMIVG